MAQIRHSDGVFRIDGFLSAVECAELIALAESFGFDAAGVRMSSGERVMPNIRNNARASGENPAWVTTLWQRLSQHALPSIAGQHATGLPKALRFYKYTTGQRFKMHKDGPWTENGQTSQLTFLVYLNDGFTGGDTDFRDFRVQPQAGSALLFIHDTWHEGAEVTNGTKLVLRSDVLYGATMG
jgi:predicted 2-oxoglutarate/Fe(II)-dependent dioxygenase YbiX